MKPVALLTAAGVAVLAGFSSGVRAEQAAAVTLFVAVDGRDANPGTATAPLATLAGARDAVRKLLSAGERRDIVVRFRAGEYPQDAPVVFEPQDSAMAGQTITYTAAPGESAVLTGGRRVDGWRVENGVWRTQLAANDSPVHAPAFRRLYVNGARRTLARFPNEGSWLRVAEKDAQAPTQTINFASGDLPERYDYSHADVVGLAKWESYIVPVKAVDAAKRRVTLAGPTKWDIQPGWRYFVENVPEALDSPGEWYLAPASGELKYVPIEGEQPATSVAVAATTPRLVDVRGQSGKPIRGLRFVNLRLFYTGYDLEPEGHSDWQAADTTPAAITFADAQDCELAHSEVAHTGACGVEVAAGCKDIRIVANEFHDLGASAVKVRKGSSHTIITDNLVHDGGWVFYGGPAIIVQDSGDNVISHNEVRDVNCTAVSVGWTWGFDDNNASRNIVEFNHIHDIGGRITTDIGGIYTLGPAPGTVLRNNLIHDIVDAPDGYMAAGIYNDEGSSHLLIENNVVYNTVTGPYDCHYGRDNLIRNNVFAFGKQMQVRMGREKVAEDTTNWRDFKTSQMTLEHNVVVYRDGGLFARDSELSADYNVYWDLRGPVLFKDGPDITKWQARGYDQHSVVADPLFVDMEKYDFRLRENSPALQLGFKPIDLSGVGPRGSVGPEK
jgi:hypothetical protein